MELDGAPPDMIDAARCRSVVGRVQDLLSKAPITPAYRQALVVALSQQNNILSNTPQGRWARTVWMCCLAAGGSWEDAIPAAAAVEIFMVALDILDDEEDREHTQLNVQLGDAGTLNASTGLLFLAQRGLAEMCRGYLAGNVLLEAGLRACSGQHSDLTSTAEFVQELDECLAVTAGKSASLVAAICQLGAICANAAPDTESLWASFGWHLGMVEQLVNDIWALRSGAAGKTDVALHKPTLPLTYATLAVGSGSREDRVMTGLYLTWAVADAYRRQALELIDRLTTNQMHQADLIALLPTLS